MVFCNILNIHPEEVCSIVSFFFWKSIVKYIVMEAVASPEIARSCISIVYVQSQLSAYRWGQHTVYKLLFPRSKRFYLSWKQGADEFEA